MTPSLASLTDEQKRVMIATSLGWDAHPSPTPSGAAWGYQPTKPHWSFVHHLPDYLNSIDVCAEFERTLTGKETAWYECHLRRLVFKATTDADWSDPGGGNANCQTWHATARQRADAYLLTRNLATP